MMTLGDGSPASSRSKVGSRAKETGGLHLRGESLKQRPVVFCLKDGSLSETPVALCIEGLASEQERAGSSSQECVSETEAYGPLVSKMAL
jgi:hypothetical protein